MKVSVFFITKKEDIHHITNVMRNSVGNKIILTFKDQSVYTCEIVEITNESITVSLTENKILIQNCQLM